MFPSVYSAKVHGIRKVSGVRGPGAVWCSGHGLKSGKSPGIPNRRLAMDLGSLPALTQLQEVPSYAWWQNGIS